ncbi:MAG: sodium:glutamate symporter, partial [Okeania sp. SIO2D1]|nr:sodium:glutamate symporter [Okeania sp. SIO2D1]
RPLQDRIAGVALDVVVVTALASISLKVLGANLGVFVILSVVGIAWNIFAFIFIAPRILTDHWFERGIGDVGQSMGVTATGILLLRMVDPHNRSGAFESFAYKQLFFEPIVGGGIFTAAAPVLVRELGSFGVLALTAGLLAFFLIFGFWNYKQTMQAREQL